VSSSSTSGFAMSAWFRDAPLRYGNISCWSVDTGSRCLKWSPIEWGHRGIDTQNGKFTMYILYRSSVDFYAGSYCLIVVGFCIPFRVKLVEECCMAALMFCRWMDTKIHSHERAGRHPVSAISEKYLSTIFKYIPNYLTLLILNL
jgi:hypothetical protein